MRLVEMATSKQWYVVHVYSGFEKKVAESIREQARQKGMELSPLRGSLGADRGGRRDAPWPEVNAERKFFPGYVLVKMELGRRLLALVKIRPR